MIEENTKGIPTNSLCYSWTLTTSISLQFHWPEVKSSSWITHLLPSQPHNPQPQPSRFTQKRGHSPLSKQMNFREWWNRSSAIPAANKQGIGEVLNRRHTEPWRKSKHMTQVQGATVDSPVAGQRHIDAAMQIARYEYHITPYYSRFDEVKWNETVAITAALAGPGRLSTNGIDMQSLGGWEARMAVGWRRGVRGTGIRQQFCAEGFAISCQGRVDLVSVLKRVCLTIADSFLRPGNTCSWSR